MEMEKEMEKGKEKDKKRGRVGEERSWFQSGSGAQCRNHKEARTFKEQKQKSEMWKWPAGH
jgi:hypothetical protein